MLEKDVIWEAIEQLPKWGGNKEGTSYWVGWKYPPFYEKYAGKICRCGRLQQIITEKCQRILDSGQFDIDWVELKFYQHGLIIDVPGNACGVYPAGNKTYSSHNVDTPAQCFSLLFFLVTALDEIYKAMGVWERNPASGLNLPVGDRTFRLDRSMESKPFELWNIRDEHREVAVVLARNSQEAEKKKDQFAEGKEGFFNCMPFFPSLNHEMVLSPLKRFDVVAEFTNKFPAITYEVIAADSSQAEEMIEEMLERELPLAKAEKIEVVDKAGKPIEPTIVRR